MQHLGAVQGPSAPEFEAGRKMKVAEDHWSKRDVLLQRSARGNGEEGRKPEEGCLQLIFFGYCLLFKKK